MFQQRRAKGGAEQQLQLNHQAIDSEAFCTLFSSL